MKYSRLTTPKVLSRTIPSFSLQTILFLIALSTVISSCKKPHSAESARKYIRAADFELIQAGLKLQKIQAFYALKTLYEKPHCPLPTREFYPPESEHPTQFQMDKHIGHYIEDEHQNFVLHRPSDSLIIDFTFNEKQQLRLIIDDYQQLTTKSGMVIPTQIKASVWINDVKQLTLDYNARLRLGFIGKIHIRMQADHLVLKLKSTVRLSKKTSHLSAIATLQNRETEILHTYLKSKIRLNADKTIGIGLKHIAISVFPLKFDWTSDRAFVHIVPQNYTDEYNRHRSMALTDMHGRKLAKLRLSDAGKKDQINIMAEYPDGTIDNLEDIMLAVKTLLPLLFKSS
ncbi:MAG: hypothetical protein M0Q41_00760 [Bacteroidales bacterium]|nr:hypothetical protein [Bacteroidales bacterium]